MQALSSAGWRSFGSIIIRGRIQVSSFSWCKWWFRWFNIRWFRWCDIRWFRWCNIR